jgi:hypothetical protein
MRRVLRFGGHAVWRSAVEPIDIREDGKAIDRVNMYASCEWVIAGQDEADTLLQSGGQRSRRWRNQLCVI